MFTLVEENRCHAVIKVFGLGGGGGNAINTMIEEGLTGVEFISANTDAQALSRNLAPLKIQMGAKLTKGLGAGADPAIGRQAAQEDRDILREALTGADMVFMTAGLGGGTGTGGGPVVAEVAREVGALTVAVVTRPFSFEGATRRKQSEMGLKELRSIVDTLIVIPNEKLLLIAGKEMRFVEAFRKVDEVLYQAVRGISELVTKPGYINLDFADVKTIMTGSGVALMGTGGAEGQNRAMAAAEKAISSPLLEDVAIRGARGMMGEELKVTVIATGFETGVAESVWKAPRRTVKLVGREDLEKPTFLRVQAREPERIEPLPVIEKPIEEEPLEEFDIPTFLRRRPPGV
jgi:cell division protein FtsZ